MNRIMGLISNNKSNMIGILFALIAVSILSTYYVLAFLFALCAIGCWTIKFNSVNYTDNKNEIVVEIEESDQGADVDIIRILRKMKAFEEEKFKEEGRVTPGEFNSKFNSELEDPEYLKEVFAEQAEELRIAKLRKDKLLGTGEVKKFSYQEKEQ